MKTLKVLQFSKFYPPAFGGIEQVVNDIIEGSKGLDKITYDVLCFNHQLNKKDECVFINDVKIMRMRTWKILASTPISFNIFKKFLKIRRNYDFIHFHVPNPIATLASLFVPKGKYIVHWHSDIVKQKKLFYFFKPLQDIMLRRCAKIIVTSEKYGAESKQLEHFRNKLITIPIGIDTTNPKINIEFLNLLKEKYQKKIVIFSLGRLAYYKGFEYLINSANYLDDDFIILIGGGGELNETLEKLIVEKKVQNKVQLLGRVSYDELSSYYSLADIFCMPSIEKSEAFGVVQLEAMLYHLPIVSTRIKGSGVDWVNSNGISGITVEPKNAEALADAFKVISRNKQLREKLSEGAYARLIKHFSVGKMCSSILDMYRELK